MKSKIRDLQILLQKEDLFGAKNFCEDFLRNQNIDDAKFYNFTPAPFKKVAFSSSCHLGKAG